MRRLTIVRPEPGASASLRLARELGMDAVSVPLFRIEAVDWALPEASALDGLLVTSANAIHFGGPALKDLRGLKVHAVGEATAAAAGEAGFDIASTGTSGVERLLGSIEPDLRLLHLCGEDRIVSGGHPQRLTELVVYRSTQTEPPEALEQVEVVALHSPRAARRFAELVDEKRSTIAIAALSRAVADAAGPGWQAVAVAESPCDRSLLVLAKELCDKPLQ